MDNSVDMTCSETLSFDDEVFAPPLPRPDLSPDDDELFHFYGPLFAEIEGGAIDDSAIVHFYRFLVAKFGGAPPPDLPRWIALVLVWPTAPTVEVLVKARKRVTDALQ